MDRLLRPLNQRVLDIHTPTSSVGIFLNYWVLVVYSLCSFIQQSAVLHSGLDEYEPGEQEDSPDASDREPQ